jgi:hypothetical protein
MAMSNDFSIDYARTNGVSSFDLGEMATKKQPPISEHYSDLQMQLQKLEEVVRELGSRLSPILTPVETGSADQTRPVPEKCSSLAMSLFQDTQKVKELQSLVGSILQRLEV